MEAGQSGLPAASFLLALARIRQALLQAQGVLHLRVRELGKDAVLDRTQCDHPLPLFGAGTCDPRSVFLYGHLQSKDDCGLVLVEYGHKAPAVDDGDPAVQHVRHVARLAVDRPDACRGDLVCKDLLFLLGCKPLLREVGPIGGAVVVGRWTDMQRVWFQPCVEPPLIALVRITPSSKLCGRPRVSLVGPVRNP